ncbi:sulfotransferase domain-containing protein [Pontibacter silvestris]|uniref:Sulfotransferase domain-containing protein n=1 Tax=Pontibacter silvestris TaxID=2305183 RepID=A0ABW4WX59_9BACT|nr:sulfotransferase domain-containing protein [Pontibacter silvestris]MCC9137322.1 sulfotransferase domain-containing protein [Pontibacter silvestris]
MKLLQGGAPKCGNFWLYQIIQQVLARTGYDTTSFIQTQPIYSLAKQWDLNYPSQASIDMLEVTDLQFSYRISSIFRMPIEDIKDYVAHTNHVWTHSPICKRSAELLELFDKKVYIIRDPRDRAISASKYYTSDYMLKYYPQEEKEPALFLEKNFEKLMLEWVWHVYDHLRLSKVHNLHIALYESFLLDFQQELARLVEYLGIELDDYQKEESQEAVSFSTLQQKNPKHLKKGQAGYWMDHLSDEQIEKADVIAGPLIRYLNYPVEKNMPMSFSTEFMHHDFEQLKQEIIASQEVLYQN